MIKEKTKFAVGDLVRWTHRPNGSYGIVVKIQRDGRLIVRYTDGSLSEGSARSFTKEKK